MNTIVLYNPSVSKYFVSMDKLKWSPTYTRTDTHRPLTTNTFITKATNPNTIITKAMTTNHAHEISNTPSLTLTTTHAHDIPTTSHMNHNTECKQYKQTSYRQY